MYEPYYDTEGGAVYCEYCAPNRAWCPGNTQESDSPQNCHECGRPLDVSLTNYGREYVLDCLRLEIRLGRSYYMTKVDSRLPYYKGCAHGSIVLDWAEGYCGHDELIMRYADRLRARINK
jgi:hypothetical protein